MYAKKAFYYTKRYYANKLENIFKKIKKSADRGYYKVVLSSNSLNSNLIDVLCNKYKYKVEYTEHHTWIISWETT